MITEDELKKYLPKYLSEENYKTLLAELKSFPYNIDGRMYTSMLDKNVIFLPANSQMEDSIVFLDKIYHVDNRFINRDTLEDQRLFSLSDYGFYMLIFKLSIHFSRIQEKVNRGCIAN